MAELSAITGAVGKDFDKLNAQSLALAKSSVTAQSEVARGIKLVASAKPELLDNLPLLVKTTEQILLLKNASGLELAEAATVGAQSLNIFGKGAEFAGKFVNILAAGSKFGSSEIQDTGQAVLLSGGAARNAGLGFLELNAAIQVAALGGFKGSQAGTALNAILGRLQRKGIDFKKLGLEKSFTLVKDALDGQTDSTKRALLASEIFGEEHAKVGFALINNVSQFGNFERKLKGTNVAQEQAAIRLNTFNTRIKQLGISIKDKLIAAFTRLEPTFSGLITKATEFIDAITPAQVNAFANSIKNTVLAISEIVKQVSTRAKPIIQEFLAVMDTKTVSNIAKDIMDMANAVNILITPLKIIAALLKGTGTGIGEFAAQLSTGNFSAGTDIGEAFSIGGKVLGLFGGEDPVIPKAPLSVPQVPAVAPTPVSGSAQQQSAQVDVNIRDPGNNVSSISSKKKGNPKAMNLGVSLKEG